MKTASIYLASQSPRRRELLQQISVDFTVVSAETDETVLEGELPEVYVQRVARLKARAGLQQAQNHAEKRPVLAADTSVVLAHQIFGKPESLTHARDMLLQLSGQTHQVMSAVCLATEKHELFALSVSDVTFIELDKHMVDWYLATGEGADKAGGYAVQGQAARFIERIAGSYSGIMGLPLFETGQLLTKMDKLSEQ
jgi:septum formation protein